MLTYYIHSLKQSLDYSFTDSLAHWLKSSQWVCSQLATSRSVTRSLFHTLIHSLTCIHPPFRPIIHSLTCIHPPFRPIIHSLTKLPACSLKSSRLAIIVEHFPYYLLIIMVLQCLYMKLSWKSKMRNMLAQRTNKNSVSQLSIMEKLKNRLNQKFLQNRSKWKFCELELAKPNRKFLSNPNRKTFGNKAHRQRVLGLRQRAAQIQQLIHRQALRRVQHTIA